MLNGMKLIAPLLTAAVLAACAGTAAATHPHPEEDAKAAKQSQERWEWRVADSKDKSENKEVIVERTGKDSKVVIDGKTIEGTVQVVQEDGKLIIKDGSGNVLREIEMPEMPGNFAFRFNEDGDLRFDDGAKWNIKTGENAHVGVRRPVIGVELEDGDGHHIIRRVIEGGPAAKAGIQADDVIIRINGDDTHNLDEIRAALEKHEPGDEVKVFVLRGGDEKSFQVKLAPAEGGNFFSQNGDNFRVFFDEDQARAMKERAMVLQKRAEDMARVRMHELQIDGDASQRIAIELKEKLEGLNADQKVAIREHMRRAEEALKGLQELELHMEMQRLPEIQILELDGKNSNRVAVVPAPDAPDAPRFRVAERAPTAPTPPAAGQWSESDSRIERLEARMEKIEALIEKIMRKLDEKNS